VGIGAPSNQKLHRRLRCWGVYLGQSPTMFLQMGHVTDWGLYGGDGVEFSTH